MTARKIVALLLDDEQNTYQRLLAHEARLGANRLEIELRPAQFAAGSSWKQVEMINSHLRSEPRPDAILLVVAGTQSMRPVIERVLAAGVSVVFLNRVPAWIAELRAGANVLVTGVIPDQAQVGRIQAEQAARLVPRGAFVMLVTGTEGSAAAASRRKAFLEAVAGRFTVCEVDGAWSTAGAEKALASWFRIGADRDRQLGLFVCQNDAMALGVRKVLRDRAAATGAPDLTRVPIVGCDGLAAEGCASVGRGELTATVVLPATTPPALATLDEFWRSGRVEGVVQLSVTSFPEIETLRHA